ncbi:hypothetical protein CJ030_MR5G010225 [Morella rubra]|uniref:Uncharacterized protein n=1 Tax=Morella rubra TaxID=262757 RepID=A0A6A1VJX4_9ROSI|nr:hypothetical protein CJ030_MR5G010225 [Morella rubra]
MLHGQLLPFWRIMHLFLCSTIDLKKHTTEVTYGEAEFLYMFLHNLMVPEGADEPKVLPLWSINKTTLSKLMAQTRRVLGAARAARAGSWIGLLPGTRGTVAELGGIYDDRVD